MRGKQIRFARGQIIWMAAGCWLAVVAASLVWNWREDGKITRALAAAHRHDVSRRDVRDPHWPSVHGSAFVPVAAPVANHQTLALLPAPDLAGPRTAHPRAPASNLTSNSRAAARHQYTMLLAHLGIGLLGLLGISVGNRLLGGLEKSHRDSERRLWATLRSIGDAVVSTDHQGRVIDLNPVAQQLTGWTAEEALGQPISHVLRLVDAFTRQTSESPVFRVLSEGRPVALADNTALIARDGTERRVADSCAPVRDELGRVTGAVMVFRDVTDECLMRQAVQDSEARFRTLFVDSPDAYLIIRDGVIVDCNRAVEAMLGCTRQEVVGQRPELLSPPTQPDGRDSVSAASEYIAQGQRLGRTRFEWLHRRFNGENFWVDVSLTVLTLSGATNLLVTWRDITERKRMEHELRKFSIVVEQTPASVVITDLHGHIEYVNPAFTRNTGYSLDEARGRNPRLLKSGKMPKDVYDGLWRELAAGREWRGELQNRRKNGELFWELAVISPLRDDNGNPTHYLAIKENISERKSMEEELRSAARTDKLTGLPNRALLCDRLQQAVLRAKRLPDYRFALLFLDFDRFKIVNDSLGHDVGDMLLQEIARRLRLAIHCDDSLNPEACQHTTARLGGDEFVVLLDGVRQPQDAMAVAERLLQVFSQPYHLGPHEVYSTVSIGCFAGDVAADSADDVLRDADTAMYEAKLAGKGQYVLFNVNMRQRVQNRLNLEQDLRKAIDANQLFLLYQPIVSLQTGAVESLEALVRWNHPQRGVISPAEFIPIAEDTGLILPMGAWILNEACSQWANWRRRMGAAAPPCVSVNLSRKQLLLPNLPQVIQQALQQAGMPPQALHLEITESAVMQDLGAASQMLRAIKSLGVKLEMDDFGTGHSSLACLHQFPIDVLKIDRTFIANIDRGRDFAALVHAVAQLARNLNIAVVAEGIETVEQAMILQSLDCEFGQGYLFSKPLSPEQVVDFRVHPSRLAG